MGIETGLSEDEKMVMLAEATQPLDILKDSDDREGTYRAGQNAPDPTEPEPRLDLETEKELMTDEELRGSNDRAATYSAGQENRINNEIKAEPFVINPDKVDELLRHILSELNPKPLGANGTPNNETSSMDRIADIIHRMYDTTNPSKPKLRIDKLV